MKQTPQIGRTLTLIALLALFIVAGCSRAPAQPPAPDGGQGEVSEEEAIQAAIVAFFDAEGSDLPSQSTVEIEGIEGDFARAKMSPNDPTATDPATIYLRRQDRQWKVLTYGTAFGPEVYGGFGIPASLQLGGAEAAGDMAFEPLPDEACAALQGAVSTALAHEATLTEAPFNDYVAGGAGMGCQVTLLGTGADFPSVGEVTETLRGTLGKAGWDEDSLYRADGPTGSAVAFRQDNQLLLLTVSWIPSKETNCSPEQPIMQCDIKPEQQEYTITLNAAQAAEG